MSIGVSQDSYKKHERIGGLVDIISTQHRKSKTGKFVNKAKCDEIVFVDVMCGSGKYSSKFKDTMQLDFIGSPIRMIRGFRKSISTIRKGKVIGINQQFHASFRFSDVDELHLNLLKNECDSELDGIDHTLDITQEDATVVLTKLRKEIALNLEKVYVVCVDPNNLGDYPDEAVWKLIKASYKSRNLFLILNIPTNVTRQYGYYNSDYFKKKNYKRRIRSIKKLQRLNREPTFANIMSIMFRDNEEIYGSLDHYGDYEFMTWCYWGGKVLMPRSGWKAQKMERLDELIKDLFRKVA